MFKILLWILLAIVAVMFFFMCGATPPSRPDALSVVPANGEAFVWYLGHCGYAVRTSDHFLVFDYQERNDGRRRKVLPPTRSLANGWINPEEIKDLKVRVFVSHSHEDHFDPIILTWKPAVPDIGYFFGWKAAEDPSFNYLVGPHAELVSPDLSIATINSHHSGVPEVAWLIKLDGLVIYHNGDCLPNWPGPEHDFLKSKSARVDLAFVFPVTTPGDVCTRQEEDFFRKLDVGAAFPMHAKAGDAMYRGFQKTFQAEFPGLRIHVPKRLGQKFVYEKGLVREKERGEE